MRFFKPVMAAVTAVISLSLLAGCSTTQQTNQTNYVAVPKMLRYGTGLAIDKKIQTLVTDRNQVIAQIEHAIGTSKTKADANAFIYDNVTSANYDLGANSPYFINKTRTTTKCSLGKAQGTDVGDGYYVVGDSFITPIPGYTFNTTTVDTQLADVVKALIKAKTVTSSYKASLKGTGKYQLTLKDGSTMRLKTTGTSSNVSIIRVTTVLQPHTCYSVNGLPYTTAKAVTAWQKADKTAGAF